MMRPSRLVLAFAALVIAFSVSVTYKLGKTGWRFELHPTPSEAEALGDASQYAELKILAQVLNKIHNEYVDESRIRPKAMLFEALQEVQRMVPEVVVRPAPGEPDDDPAALEVVVGTHQRTFDLAQMQNIFLARHRLRGILQFIGEHLSDPEIEPKDIEYAAINGMLATLDPHSVHMPAESFREMKVNTRGSFGGLGIVISIREGELTVISPIDDTPASRAGLKAADKIVRINEESTVNMRLQEAVERLRGKVKTDVTVWILRKGWTAPKQFTLTREQIQIHSVESKLLEGGVGYVKVKNFQENTTAHLKRHIQQMRDDNGGDIEGLVLDLRNNPGGLLGQAIKVSDLFLDSGTIVLTVGAGNKQKETKDATWRGTEDRYPLVVLVNSGSASASEIVAGALKNQDRALVIGEQTFGKGSVQVLFNLGDSSALKLTVAQYLTPGEVSIQSVGIVPDLVSVPVTFTGDDISYYAGEQGVREADLDEHLTNEAARAEARASRRMHYWEPPEEDLSDDEVAKRAAREAAGRVGEPDFQMRLARDLIRKVGGSGMRREMLRNAEGFLDRVQGEETAKIGEALAKLKVDWTDGANDPTNIPVVKVSTSAGPKGVVAGEELTVTAEVTNRGDTALHRVRAMTDSDSRTLDDLEFVFGLIKPGETRSWSTKVTVPKDEDERVDELTLTVHSAANAAPLAGTSLRLRTTALPRPHFRWAWQVDDSATGDGDGVLRAGETADVLLHVQNVGDGAAVETLSKMNLDKNVDRRFIDLKSGRASLGALPVGKIATGRFQVAIRPGATDQTFKAEFSMLDTELRVGAVEALDMPLARSATKSTPFAGALRVKAKGGTPLRAWCGSASIDAPGGRARGLGAGAGAGATPANAQGADAGGAAAPPQLGEAPGGAWLAVTAKCGNWYRVLDGDRIGYVAAADVKAYKERRPAKNAKKVEPRWAGYHEAPRIELDASVVDAHVDDAQKIRIRGKASDDTGVVDYSVYVYTKHGRRTKSRKVAFVPNPAASAASASPGSTASSGNARPPAPMEIDQEVPLEPGLNRIVVVARDRNRLTSSATLVIHRKAEPTISAKTPDAGAGAPDAKPH